MLTWAIQKTGYDYDRFDSQGNTDFEGFIRELENFPWREQLALWNEAQDGPLPAIVLQNASDQRELHISALGAELGDSFQLHSLSMREKKGWFGMGKPRTEREVVTFDVVRRTDVDRLCELFCGRRYDEMDGEVTRLADESWEREQNRTAR